MKISLPDNTDDITLFQYMELMKMDEEAKDYESQIFSLFTGVDIKDVGSVPIKQRDEFLKHIYNALQSKGEFKQTFTIDGVDFGLIPNFDKITGDEYTDLVRYSVDTDLNLDRLISVLYRPIKSKDNFKNYKLYPYEGTSEHVEMIRKLPMSTVNGCLGFFLTLSNDLEGAILRYMEEEQAKEATH